MVLNAPLFVYQKIIWPLGNKNGTRAKWTKFPSHGIKAPECRETMWSRDNHLGNGKGGFTNKYNWTLPNIENENCAIRIRYLSCKTDFFIDISAMKQHNIPVH